MKSMDQIDKAGALAIVDQKNSDEPAIDPDNRLQGLADWLLRLFQDWRSQRLPRRRQLRLVETLPLGGKRELMLVACGGESFLVGCGSESIQTVVALTGQYPQDLSTSADGPCS